MLGFINDPCLISRFSCRNSINYIFKNILFKQNSHKLHCSTLNLRFSRKKFVLGTTYLILTIQLILIRKLRGTSNNFVFYFGSIMGKFLGKSEHHGI